MSTENRDANMPAGAGCDGGTLLGFLASVGALVAFTRLFSDKLVTLHWELSLGWRGRIHIDGKALVLAQIQALHSSLTEPSVRDLFTLRKGSDGSAYQTITKIEIDHAADYLSAALEREVKVCRHSSATLAGWFIDQRDEDSAGASRLCGLTGGSQQNFLETALHLSGFHPKEKERFERVTTAEHLISTLLEVWQFRDRMPGCRWEAQEDRHSALRHAGTTKKHKATGDVDTKGYDGSVCTQRGANRLGIEGMTCFPLMPGVRRAETTGFRSDRKGWVEQFTWPVWECPLTLETVRVLVAHPELTRENPRHQKLFPLGVRGVFRTTRVTKGKGQVSFTIAHGL